jgi:predicted nucleotidyltransferase
MMLVADLTRDEVVSRLLRLESTLRSCGRTRLAIFGSRARGDQRPESDPDALIDVEGGRKFSLLDLVGVAHVIEDARDVCANIFMRRSLEPQMTTTIRRGIIGLLMTTRVYWRLRAIFGDQRPNKGAGEK